MSLILVIHNDSTGTEESANYDWQVRINQEILEHGRLEGHNRSHGYKVLLRSVLADIKGHAPTARQIVEKAYGHLMEDIKDREDADAKPL